MENNILNNVINRSNLFADWMHGIKDDSRMDKFTHINSKDEYGRNVLMYAVVHSLQIELTEQELTALIKNTNLDYVNKQSSRAYTVIDYIFNAWYDKKIIVTDDNWEYLILNSKSKNPISDTHYFSADRKNQYFIIENKVFLKNSINKFKNPNPGVAIKVKKI